MSIKDGFNFWIGKMIAEVGLVVVILLVCGIVVYGISWIDEKIKR